MRKTCTPLLRQVHSSIDDLPFCFLQTIGQQPDSRENPSTTFYPAQESQEICWSTCAHRQTFDQPLGPCRTNLDQVRTESRPSVLDFSWDPAAFEPAGCRLRARCADPPPLEPKFFHKSHPFLPMHSATIDPRAEAYKVTQKLWVELGGV